jgi:hypothetical protein
MSGTQNSAAAVAAKYVLKEKTDAGLKDIGKVFEREGKEGSIYMTVENTDLIIGTNQDGNLVLKKKNTDPTAQYKYETIGRLFENQSKAGNTWFRAKTREGVVYMMFPNTPKPAGKRTYAGNGARPSSAANGFQRTAKPAAARG